MKILIIIVLLVSSNCLIAQKTYNTYIDTATSVEIKDGITYITKAGAIILVVTPDNTPIFVDSITQTLDTSGIFITKIHIINPVKNSYDYNIKFLADKPISWVEGFAWGAINYETLHSEHYYAWVFKGTAQTTRGIDITLKSNEKIKIDISGTAGFIKH